MLLSKFRIGSHVIGEDDRAYIIAEAGSNFNQNLDTAKRLIDVASESGADAVKFQLFRAEILYPDGGKMHELFKSIELDPNWVPILDKHASDSGIQFIASAFDKASVDVLESVNVSVHKIASSETTNLGFLHYVASKHRPMLIATGMCDFVDIEEAINVCLAVGNKQIVLLQCGAMYPLPADLANLRVIEEYSKRYSCPVGFSDHTFGITAATTAVGIGARVFEKHFTLDRTSPGPDHIYAMEPNELKSYVEAIHEGVLTLGQAHKDMLPKEKEVGRREGLYAARDIAAGEQITAADLHITKPAIGLRSRYSTAVVGAIAAADIKENQPITWDLFTV